MYTVVWRFEVRAGCGAAFTAAYRADGDWVRLFQKGQGFLGTELMRDVDDSAVYVTIDSWESEEDYRRFRQQYSAEYAQLDRELDGLTGQERLVGEWHSPEPGKS